MVLIYARFRKVNRIIYKNNRCPIESFEDCKLFRFFKSSMDVSYRFATVDKVSPVPTTCVCVDVNDVSDSFFSMELRSRSDGFVCLTSAKVAFFLSTWSNSSKLYRLIVANTLEDHVFVVE